MRDPIAFPCANTQWRDDGANSLTVAGAAQALLAARPQERTCFPFNAGTRNARRRTLFAGRMVAKTSAAYKVRKLVPLVL